MAIADFRGVVHKKVWETIREASANHKAGLALVNTGRACSTNNDGSIPMPSLRCMKLLKAGAAVASIMQQPLPL